MKEEEYMIKHFTTPKKNIDAMLIKAKYNHKKMKPYQHLHLRKSQESIML
jgi:hypothetical protein